MNDNHTTSTRVAELEADNRRLRRLLEQRDAPGELRHRLRNTIALLRAIIRKSAVTPRDTETYAGRLEGRLDALARAQAEADANGGSDLYKLLTDELLQYDLGAGDRLSITGPDVCLMPRAAQVFALASHELAINSVEHGAAGADGHLLIRWDVLPSGAEQIFFFSWREELARIAPPPGPDGFGFDILRNMLGYELRATTSLEVNPGAFACTIQFPFSHEVGVQS